MFSQTQSIDVEIEQKTAYFRGFVAYEVAVPDIREINKICGIIYCKLKHNYDVRSQKSWVAPVDTISLEPFSYMKNIVYFICAMFLALPFGRSNLGLNARGA